jgi:hypothetical protein
MKNLNLKYNIPIKEFISQEGNDFIIQGEAIHECITGNNHQFLKEELVPAAASLQGVKLLVDHRNEVSSIKGRVIQASYDEIINGIGFQAKVNDKEIQDLISRGDLDTVSVGAQVNSIEEGENGTLIPRGIIFKELSLVAVPADADATFGVANSFEFALKESYDEAKKTEDPMMKCKVCGKMVPKSEIKEGMCKECWKANSCLNVQKNESERGSKMSEEKLEEKEVEVSKADTAQMIQDAIKQGIAEGLKQLQEIKKTEEVKVEVKSDKGIEETQTEEKSGYSIVEGSGSIRGGSFTLVRNYGKC